MILQNRLPTIIAIIILPLGFFSTTGAAVRCVDKNNASGTATGTAAKPYVTIQAAITAAATGDTVKVAGGTYQENLSWSNKKVVLLGSFTGGDAAAYTGAGGDFQARNTAANRTTIRGTGTTPIINLGAAHNSVIDGFRITGGDGGGIRGSDWPGTNYLTVSNNVMDSMNAPQNGMAIMFNGTGCRAVGNTVKFNHLVNTNTLGAAISVSGDSAYVERNWVEGNINAGNHAAGITLNARHAWCTDNYVASNTVAETNGAYGGGIYSGGPYPSACCDYYYHYITGNIVCNNTGMGGIFVDNGSYGIVRNNTIYGNSCGIFVDGPWEAADIINNTIVNNRKDPNYETGILVRTTSVVNIINNIIWGHPDKDISVVGTQSVVTVSYCDFATSELTGYPAPTSTLTMGAGNINTDPLFADTAAHDFHVKSTGGRWNPAGNGGLGAWAVDGVHSPTIDAGSPDSAYGNEPGPNGSRINIGAEGNTIYASKSAGGSWIVPRYGNGTFPTREPIQLEASPNPFNQQTGFRIQNSEFRMGKMPVLNIYNTAGKCVARLAADRSPLAASYTWNASQMPAGVYVARLQVGTQVRTKRVMLTK